VDVFLKHGVYMVIGECAHEQHVRRTHPNPNSHDHCLLSKWKCRTCAHTHLCN